MILVCFRNYLGVLNWLKIYATTRSRAYLPDHVFTFLYYYTQNVFSLILVCVSHSCLWMAGIKLAFNWYTEWTSTGFRLERKENKCTMRRESYSIQCEQMQSIISSSKWTNAAFNEQHSSNAESAIAMWSRYCPSLCTISNSNRFLDSVLPIDSFKIKFWW